MLSKQHYEAIARVMSDAWGDAKLDAQKSLLKRLCLRLEDMFERDNPGFQFRTWRKACGFEQHGSGVDISAMAEAARAMMQNDPYSYASQWQRRMTPPPQGAAPIPRRNVTATELAMRYGYDYGGGLVETHRMLPPQFGHDPVTETYTITEADLAAVERRTVQVISDYNLDAVARPTPLVVERDMHTRLIDALIEARTVECHPPAEEQTEPEDNPVRPPEQG